MINDDQVVFSKLNKINVRYVRYLKKLCLILLDLQQFLEKGLQLRNPPSPKLVVSGNMSQQKTTTGSPKSPKSPDDNSKSDSASSSPSKSGRSPSSTKSSPGSIKSSLAERLAQSNKAKVNQSLRSPVSKSSPTSPTALG
jgi:hypothetical protein